MGAVPLFSICIPAHNAMPLIEQTFISIASQTCKDWEVVVVDDCSKDEIGMWLEKQNYVASERITYICLHENMGPFYARRVAFRAARGRYILCVDADDEFVGGSALEKLSSFIIQETKFPDLVMFNSTLDKDAVSKWVDYESEGIVSGVVPMNQLIEAFTTSYVLNNLWLKAIKRELLLPAILDDAGGLVMCEDRLEVAGVLCKSKSAALLDIPLYFYRQNAVSTTHRRFELDYCYQQGFVEDCIASLFPVEADSVAAHTLFLRVWADDMERIALGRTVFDTVECYRRMKSNAHFKVAFVGGDPGRLRFDHRLLLKLLWKGDYRAAAYTAAVVNVAKAAMHVLCDKR
ncbi:glycosyltransferase family A protein [Paratractidigestivibacter sp.]|uniref:glycosyltransferase family 2 protein n=1 Tax=Paratractidigestivibacter sp. TaxID=2847316 RepID=UPI002ACB0981|nr:glycosyltransferase family A protein [Paratractidigestivibacter sp.]